MSLEMSPESAGSALKPCDPFGPVFLCHRNSDGAALARELASVLWAHGVPVWVDESDFPPGDTEKRMEEALAGGLSGAVIVVTPEIIRSRAVQGIELRRILELEDQYSDFMLAVANSILDPRDPSKPDYEAPDRLLLEPTSQRLAGITQYLVEEGNPQGLERLAAAIVRERLRVLSTLRSGGLVVDIESRLAATARMARGVDLVVRLEQPEEGRRLLAAPSWRRFRPFLGLLPDLAAECSTDEVIVQGGAHLSVGFALGAALPSTSPLQLLVDDREGKRWGEEIEPATPFGEDPQELSRMTGEPVAIYVNMTDRPEGDDAFGQFLRRRRDEFSGGLRLTSRTPSRMKAEEGEATAVALERSITEFAAAHGTREIHLFLRVPFPLSVLLGRRFNTYTIHLHEWDGVHPPTYRPALVVASGRGGGPIIEVTASD